MRTPTNGSRVRTGGAEQAFRFSPRTMGVAIGLFAIGYLALAFQVPEYTAVEVPVQPGTLPRWLGVVLLGLAVLLCFQHDPRADEAAEEATDEADEESAAAAAETPLGRFSDIRLEVLVFLAGLTAYILLFEPLGFVLSSAAYLAASTWYLGYRRPVVTAAVALGVPFVLYAAMTWGLGVVLPQGPLPF